MSATPGPDHTPGPWHVVEPHCIATADGEHVVCGGHDYDEYGIISSDANARLIAAAPDLLVACREMLTPMAIAIKHLAHTDQCEAFAAEIEARGLNGFGVRAQAAIAKAEGREP